ncbi:hypothetical protein ScPMuIL_006988 [Solemya velum]
MSPDVQQRTDMATHNSYQNCNQLQVCDCSSLEPLYDDDSETFYTLSENIWNKFELLPTPPLSPTRDDSDLFACIDEAKLFDLSEYIESVAGTFPESPPSPSLHTKLIQDCMWSDTTSAAGKSTANKLPNCTSTNCEVQTTDCVDPTTVFPYPITNVAATELKEHSLGIETPSDSEEEIDVVTVEKQRHAATVKRKAPVVNILSVESTEEKMQQTIPQVKIRLDTLSHCHNYSLPHPGTKRGRSLPSSPEHSPKPSKRSKKELNVPELRQAVQKLKSCSSRNSSDSEECGEKRTQHNVLERKRRNDLKYSFFTLRDSVPELFKQERAAKVVILKKAADYITSLCIEHEKLSKEKDNLKIANDTLKNKLARVMAASTRLACPVIILGSTGTGKSKLAIQLARSLGGEIISADSMQIYKGLDIITNKVTHQELQQCRHHMIGYLSPLKFGSTVVEFRDTALPIMDQLLQDDRVPVVVGGTNYYIEALLWNFVITSRDVLRAAKVKSTSPTEACMTRTSLSEHRGAPVVDSDNHHSTAKKHSLKNPNKSSFLDGSLHNDERYSFCAAGSSKHCHDNIKIISKDVAMQSTLDFDGHEVSSEECNEKTCHSLLSQANSHVTDVKPDLESCIHNREHISQEMEADEGQLRQGSTFLTFPTEELYRRLEAVDQEIAQRLHPNDRRKIISALRVYEKHGVPLSAVHQAQKSCGSQLDVSGPVRYQKICILWIQCDMEVLRERLDQRVDEMMERGLIQELTDFHEIYNQDRLREDKVADYTLGIFQSIGFKEFHKFLILSKEERESEQGRKLFEEGIEDLKRVTRKYARKQVRWIENRFLRRPGSDMPPVFGLDGTDLSKWEANVEAPALEIVKALMEGRQPLHNHLQSCGERENRPARNVCDVCDGRVFVTSKDWEAHLGSRRHKKRLQTERKKNQLRETRQNKDVRQHIEGTEILTEKSELPTEKSELLTEKSELLTERSELPTEKSELPTEKSELLTEKSELLTEKSELPTEK